MTAASKGAYGPNDDIVDYILGITFEIWEQRGVDLIHQYYGADCTVYGMDGIVHGAEEMVAATWATLASFPDRNLVPEAVIWSDDGEQGRYSSHRLSSRATNNGETMFGPATSKPIRMTNIADCVIKDGMIVKEWLVRDNMTLAQQLGAEPIAAAKLLAARRNDELRAWLAAERSRLESVSVPAANKSAASPSEDADDFAWRVMRSCWQGDRQAFNQLHAPYCIMHRTPFKHYSGRDAVFDYFQGLRQIMGEVCFSVDHVASVPCAPNGTQLAIRWSASGTHAGEFMGVAATGKPLYILGVSHLECLEGKVIIGTTIFDDLALLSQMIAD